MAARHIRTGADGKFEWYGHEFTAKVCGDIDQKLARIGNRLVDRIRKNIGVQCDFTHHSAPGGFPYRESGELQQSIFWAPRSEGFLRTVGNFFFGAISGKAVRTIYVGFTSKHGLAMELGMEGGVNIYPKKIGGFLAWENDQGDWVFARKVVQGKIAPRPFMQRSLKDAVPDIQRDLASSVTIN